ncbi:inhibitor of sigma-G Gin [Thermoanaerobacter sp. YS13]|uniref:sigma factor G inhibitor Gin n=1 Tax=Thermoanaerobacter sp. YS13 TaxID=1511746 RepID=UPI0005736B0B|nr:sigma factor G inhibitor Gin [Thermoanaerobacter sp. YS13]KHO61502.1 inhibitor of sigma-G Gin [Thermoanaerobacter sp. YS13]
MVLHMESIVTKRKCFICEQELRDGVEVLGKFLCANCQQKLINLSPFDDGYDFYRQKMIDIWEGYMKDIKYKNRI